MRDQTLLAQRIDEDSLHLQGDPSAVAEDVSVNIYNSRPAFWVSDGGLLTSLPGSTFTKRPLVWVDRDGKQQTAAPDETYWNLSLAPGAERMAFSKWGTTSAGLPNLDVWVQEFGRGITTRLTTDPARDGRSAWAPNGQQLAFSSARNGGVAQIYRMQASGTGEPVRLTDGGNYKMVQDWSGDGRYIVYTELGDLMAVPSEGGSPLPVVRTPSTENDSEISPDGRWIAFAANDSGRFEVYVQAFAPGDQTPRVRWPVSTNGASSVKWRGDSRELYYQSPDGSMMAAALQTTAEGLRVSTPRELFRPAPRAGRSQSFDVTADGQRFLIILAPEQERSRLTVVSNWQAILQK